MIISSQLSEDSSQFKKMVKSNFENLQVYQLSETLADEIWNIVGSWEPFAKDTVGKQMIGSVDNIGANIAEATSWHSFQENEYFIRMAIGSLNETRYWLRRAYSRHLLTREQVKKLKPLVDELYPQLNAYLTSLTNISDKHDPPQN